MYIKFSPNVTDAGGLVNYLSKEDTLVHDQLEAMEVDPAFNGYVKGYVSYLTKEDRPEKKEYFFNDQTNMAEADEVAMKIEGNCKGLKKEETRFFMVTLSPSERELKHLRDIAGVQARMLQSKATVSERAVLQETLFRDMLKQHTCDVMNQYARHFGREGIESSRDLVWYGKVEKDRYWKHDSPEVMHNRRILADIRRLEWSGAKTSAIKKLRSQLILESQVRSGGVALPIYEDMPKSGLNYHIHVVVSRRDAAQKVSLSPLAKQKSSPNHKINGVTCKVGFDRDAFAQKVEQAFDTKFQYLRSFGETYEGRKLAKNNPEMYREARIRYNREHGIVRAVLPKRRERVLLQNMSRTIQMRAINGVARGLLNQAGMRASGLGLVTQLARNWDGRMRAIASTNPQLAKQLIQKQITRQVANHLVKGAARALLNVAGLSVPGLNVISTLTQGISALTKQASYKNGQEHEI